jgi:hypothetical protein
MYVVIVVLHGRRAVGTGVLLEGVVVDAEKPIRTSYR